jgi:type I restriction enzyme S subunit
MRMAKATLAELCSLVTDGTHDSPKLLQRGIPFIKGKHINQGFVDFEHCDFISAEDHQKVISRSKPELGDTLFANIGNSIGDAAYISTSREFSIKNVALFKPNPKRVNSRYLYYHLISRNLQDSLLLKKSGSAQPFLGLDTLRGHSIQYHSDLSEQETVANTLSAYDHLIENNTRRIRILEHMAQMLYREWFVNFRFPGHEKVKMVESEMGLIPASFELALLESIAQVLRGRSYKGSELSENGGLPFVNLKCIARDGGFRLDGMKRYTGAYKPTQVAKAGDIIMAVTDMTQERRIVARCGRVPSLPEGFATFSMDVVKIQPNQNFPREYLYSFLRFSTFADPVKERRKCPSFEPHSD